MFLSALCIHLDNGRCVCVWGLIGNWSMIMSTWAEFSTLLKKKNNTDKWTFKRVLAWPTGQMAGLASPVVYLCTFLFISWRYFTWLCGPNICNSFYYFSAWNLVKNPVGWTGKLTAKTSVRYFATFYMVYDARLSVSRRMAFLKKKQKAKYSIALESWHFVLTSLKGFWMVLSSKLTFRVKFSWTFLAFSRENCVIESSPKD